MRGDIFDHDHGGGGIDASTEQIAVLVLSALSILAGLLVMINFQSITAAIAVEIVAIISSGLPIVIGIIAIIVLVIKIKWSIWKRFLGW